ncbi:MAG: prepilin-type N-terminal cleavage/methylation domain-containing protein [Burkholderiaceae bacterium]|jgi:type IV pilus assembly protein PilW|nr:prepilin-type N-terminal cleavage/methylation domain-containing protein [Burkholderiaceae bacterium]
MRREQLTHPCRRQRGLSLVELMVGIAVGLFIVAGTVTLATSQLSENRRVLLETQVQQDLRAAADIIARDLRRAGRQSDNDALLNVAQPLPLAPPAMNDLAEVTIGGGAGNADVRFSYRQPSGDRHQAGFHRVSARGTIRMLIGGNPQDLTDPNTLEVTAFDVVPVTGPTAPLRLPCPRLCLDGTEDCWPTLQVRELLVTIAGRARSDPAVAHQVATRVRLRNDALNFNNAGAGICP